MSQTDFQKRAFLAAQAAHSVADRADARILMSIIDAVDEGDFAALAQLTQALQKNYRTQLGALPTVDGDQAAIDTDGDRT